MIHQLRGPRANDVLVAMNTLNAQTLISNTWILIIQTKESVLLGRMWDSRDRGENREEEPTAENIQDEPGASFSARQ